MLRRFSLLSVLLLLTPLLLVPLSTPAAAFEDDEDEVKHRSFDLAVNGYGVGFGNSARLRGLRFNWKDRDVEEVIGVNITFWRPGESFDGRISGFQFGFFSPRAATLDGLSVGILAVEADDYINGIALALLAVTNTGETRGISIAGLANITGDNMYGISIAGLANVSGGELYGVGAALLANVN